MTSETSTPLEQLHDSALDVGADLLAMRLHYRFGMDVVLTKISMLQREFEGTRDYSPIEHVRSRLKTPQSLIAKAQRLGVPLVPSEIKAHIRDIAGIRVTCSFTTDVYWIAQMLSQQPDVTVVEVKDYIKNPKANGYRSLHQIISVPVYLSDRTEHVFVELQIRTIAMDFWASVEHKLFYKHDTDLPDRLRAELDFAARLAADLDERMENLRTEIEEPSVSRQALPPTP
ncbi:GTP pyrophosphokinase family protein [Nocardioides sp.]|uniref:GTP pyrophosphokinase n=1 Tax=Nocardioides sp. TaxID=35761 RepID=UPI0026301671|nr:GTP pyrophosphokinase family protein [Nocardioides sp.]